MSAQHIRHESDRSGDDSGATTRVSDQPDRTRGERRRGAVGWVLWGLLSGFLAGVAFIALQAWYVMVGGGGVLTSFRTVATLVEGPPPGSATVWVGMLVHLVVAAGLGLVFAALLAPLRRRSAGWLAWAGLLYGAAVYVVDLQILRVVPWFSAFLGTNQAFEAAAHLVFGAVLGALTLLAKPRSGRPRLPDSPSAPMS
ncbi:hypothetical protein GCM10010472_21340 [Pseudonocardia halophobica]|uniref:Uncharacterized protein n=1 Tax=Pseudonocardia halophobica TaxID=29401 RepID=A0A9W6KZD8_9PSEU|nr:hypothetical protein [Pseudonocardia halophobica]GLL09366.1 hypothetical protein GCM10017577_05060 [Pseudonocardia halophobica]